MWRHPSSFLANTKSVWRKGIHIIVHLLVLDRIRSKRTKARRAKLFLQLGLDASLSFLSTSRRENPRIREHLRDVERNDKDASKPVARHFNLPNHSKQHMAVCGLSLHLGSSESRKTLEQKFIFQIGTLNPQGINERFSFN